MHDVAASSDPGRHVDAADAESASNDASESADAQTIGRVLAGDREAFGVLVARYTRRLHDLARRMLRDSSEAEDAVQQAFLNAFRALDRFDPRRPFRHWLLRITSNLCRNRLVARRHRPEPVGLGAGDRDAGADRVLPDPPARVDAPPDPDDARDADRVRLALDALPETYRWAAVLRYVHGLDLAEIAAITDDPVATVKTHLHRARAVLRESLRGMAPAAAPSATTTPRSSGRGPETPPGRAGTVR